MDVNDFSWIIPVAIVGLVFLILALVFGRMFLGWRVKQRVLQTGVPATATIVRVWDTGTRINNNPRVGMLLQVQPATGPSFQAEIKETVSVVQMPMFQPGAQLDVKYDPAQPTNVAIVSVISRDGAMGGPGLMNAAGRAIADPLSGRKRAAPQHWRVGAGENTSIHADGHQR